MKIHFEFTLEDYQAEDLCECISYRITSLLDAKLDHINQPEQLKALDIIIQHYKSLLDIVTKSSKKL